MKVWQIRNLTDHSEKKRTQKFLSEIKAMIDHVPSKSIRAIARNMGMSEFFLSGK